ncbi:DUF4214 domain-containing protein [Vreelandella venusta]|uniref:DUF4214 domain-containing protein n=1 Tax=Vreelandella venusta TaxID=44935 RepID=UPI00384CBFDC
METTNAIQQIYIGLLGRAADQEGLQYWTDEIEAGTLTLEQLRANIVEEQPEYEATFGGQTRAQVVSQLYANLFNRAPDSEGLQYWVNGEGASVNIDQLVLALVNGAAAADSLVLDNRTEVANYYTEEQGAAGSFDEELAGAVIADVDGTRASVEQAKASVDNGDITAPTPNEGNTFTLTTATGENIVGTADNDQFRAVLDAGTPANGTLNTGDVINGAGGQDTLNLFVVGAAGSSTLVPGGGEISNIETVNLVKGTGGDLSNGVDASQFAGATQVWQKGFAAAELGDVTKVGAGVTVGIDGTTNAAATTDIDLTAAFTKSTGAFALSGVENTGGADSDIVLTANSVGTAAADATKTLTVNGGVTEDNTGVLELIDAVDGTVGTDVVETLNLGLTGEDITVNAAEMTKLKSIDASSSTADITTTVNAGTLKDVTSVKLGSGADDLTLNVDAKDMTVDLGAGNDVLTTGATASASNAAAEITLGAGKDTVEVASALNNIVGAASFEDGKITIADFKIGEDTLDFKAAGTATLVTLSSAQLDTANSAASLQDAIASVDALLGSNGEAAVFSYDGNAYVFVEQNTGTNGLADGDGLIELMGVDAAALSTDQNGGLLV